MATRGVTVDALSWGGMDAFRAVAGDSGDATAAGTLGWQAVNHGTYKTIEATKRFTLYIGNTQTTRAHAVAIPWSGDASLRRDRSGPSGPDR